jgi:cold-inducible RNA-binding protein
MSIYNKCAQFALSIVCVCERVCYLKFFVNQIMSKKLFVGSLDWGVASEDLQQAFSQFGEIEDAIVIKDNMSGRSKGFGFVTFVNDADADKALAEMEGKEINGRAIVVNEARPQQPRAPRNDY